METVMNNTTETNKSANNGSRMGKLLGIVLLAAGLGMCKLFRAKAIAEEATTGSKVAFALSIILVIVSIIIIFVSYKKTEPKPVDVKKLTMAAMMAALCYIGFAFLKIDIPVPGSMEKTAFHLGNVFCVLAAMILGGLWGGLSGAVGMTIGDLFGGYITSAPKTFFLKLCIGLIAGLFAHKIFKIDEETNKKKVVWKTIVSTSAAMLFNVVADPIVGYFYKRYLFGIPQDIAKTLAKLGATTTLVNAIVAVVAATIFYLALRPALKRMFNSNAVKKAE